MDASVTPLRQSVSRVPFLESCEMKSSPTVTSHSIGFSVGYAEGELEMARFLLPIYSADQCWILRRLESTVLEEEQQL